MAGLRGHGGRFNGDGGYSSLSTGRVQSRRQSALSPGVLASTLERIVGQRSLGNVMCRYKGLSWGCEPVNSDSGVGFMRVLDEVVEAIVVLPAKQF